MRKLAATILVALAATAAGAAEKILTFFPSDYNGDGHADIMWRNASTGDVYRMLMSGPVVYEGATIYREPDAAWKIAASGDFNCDGKTDLLWRHATSGDVYMQLFDWNGRPSAGYMVYNERDPAWKIIDGADIDGDSCGDILWWNAATGRVYAMLMRGIVPHWQGYIYEEPNTAWKIVGVGRFDSTGKQLLWHNDVSGEVYLQRLTFTGYGVAQWGEIVYQEPDVAWKIAAVLDLDGNFRSDILWRNEKTGHVYGMIMNGAWIMSQGTIYIEPNLDWKLVATYDYDLDLCGNLLWRNEADGRVFMHQLNGLSVTGGWDFYSEPDPAWHIMGPREYALQR